MAAGSLQLDLSTAGALSVLLRVKPGGPVCAFGNVPEAMKGKHWASERYWRVFLWFGSQLYCCRVELITEQPQPWSFHELAAHQEKYPEQWARIN